jgi:2',3'-cyclic-nucleotide 2'-phosphodiesterase (5'-nucleotidase family)
MINKTRCEENPVLLLDCGGFFSTRFINLTGKLIADKGLKAMNLMGYTAMNVGPGEFSFGVDFLSEKSAELDFPLVASNLSYAKGVSPFTKRYVMAQAGGLKVAILGVMPPGILDKMPRSKTSGVVEVIPPGEALEALLPGIRKEADIVILLSQLGLAETKILVDGLKGIDLAIYGGTNNKPAGCAGEIKPESPTGKSETPVLKASARGTHLGYALLTVHDAGRVAMGPTKMIYLDDSVAMDDNILEITGSDIYKEIARKRKRAAEEQRREIEELHKLTPMEYMQKVLKEESRGGTSQ